MKMDSFSKTTLTRSSTIWNCARILSFRVFRGRDEGDNCGCCFQKLVSMWFLIFSVLVLVPCSYGSTLPVSAQVHYTNEWSPNQDRISYNYNNPTPNYRSGSIASIPTYPVQRQQHVSRFQATKSNQDHNQPQEREHILPEPKPRTDELNEKFGFSLPSLSSLLPTSILTLPQQSSDSENQIEADGNNDSPYLDDSELRQNPQQSQNSNNPGFTQEDQPNFEENGPYDSDSSSSGGGGLLSRIRNVLPFGNGFLSGLLSNPDSNVEDEGNEDGSLSGGIENDPNININQDPSSASNDSPPISDLSQVSITNEEDPDTGSSEKGGTSQAFSNPLRAMLNLLNLRPPALSDNKQSLDLPDLGSTNPLAQLGEDGDSPITALQSLVDGAGDGVVGTAMSLLSTIASTIGITSTNATWFILLGLALGPIIGTAIAASVIAIVYASIYIPAAAIRNEGLDGEFYLLTLKRLSEVLGIPDPLDELFDSFGKRSYEGRALVRNNSSRKLAFLAGTVHESEECMERAFCELVRRKLTGKQEGKRKWIAKVIRRAADILNNENYLRSYSSSNIVRIGRSLFEAMSTGISSGETPRPKRSTMAGNNTTESVSPDSATSMKQNPCTKYVCDPLKSLRALLTKMKLDTLAKPFKVTNNVM